MVRVSPFVRELPKALPPQDAAKPQNCPEQLETSWGLATTPVFRNRQQPQDRDREAERRPGPAPLRRLHSREAGLGLVAPGGLLGRCPRSPSPGKS